MARSRDNQNKQLNFLNFEQESLKMGQTISSNGFQPTTINDSLLNPPRHNFNSPNTNGGAGLMQDKKYPIPETVTASVKSGDSPDKLKWRALHGAAQTAGLPPAECKSFANAYFKTSIEWTDVDPSPNDHTKSIQATDLKAGETVRYHLSDGEKTSLTLRQTSYQLAGGKLGSQQNLPSTQDQAKAKNVFDQTELRRRQIEQKLMPSGGVNSTQNTVASSAPPLKPLAEYKADALKLIQKPGGVNVNDSAADVRERNKTITGAYANLYLKNPEAFGWIGAAAYASGQVGFAMDLAVPIPNTIDGNDPTGDFTAAAGVFGTVTNNIREMLGKGNITIFENIYPASLAYQNGGIEELKRIENSLTGQARNDFAPVRAAYEQIDDGIKLNKANAGAGDQKIKDGTNAIIEFEQKVVLQPIFDEYAVTSRLIAPFAFGDLDAEDLQLDLKTLALFHRPTVALSYDLKLAPTVTNNEKSFANQDDRVNWIKNDVFPLWDTKRKERPEEVSREMQKIVERGRAAGGQY